MRFTWDPKKAAPNVRKHRVTFEEAASVFMDPLAVTRPDDLHPGRSIIVGLSERARVLLCVYVEFGEHGDTRLISARLATAHERRDYEEGHS